MFGLIQTALVNGPEASSVVSNMTAGTTTTFANIVSIRVSSVAPSLNSSFSAPAPISPAVSSNTNLSTSSSISTSSSSNTGTSANSAGASTSGASGDSNLGGSRTSSSTGDGGGGSSKGSSSGAASSSGGKSSGGAESSSDGATSSSKAGSSDSKSDSAQENQTKDPTQSASSDIAAGEPIEDVASKFGIWVQAIGGIANQHSRKGSAAFNTDTSGGIIGLDTMVNDSTIIGFAAGSVLSNAKYKGSKQGDKTISKSWIFVAYGNYNIDSKWFVRSSLVGGSSAINSHEQRISALGNKIVSSKYNVKSYNAEASVGYNYAMRHGGTLTPSLGIRTTYTSGINYTEKGGFDALNKQLRQKASITNTALAGIQYVNPILLNNLQISPEAHINMQYGIGVKSPKGTQRFITGTAVYTFVGMKPPALSYAVGGSVTMSTDSREYSIGYDANLSDKYLGHQGSIKVKLKL